jgi:ABC-type nitrate/sulfonate/bicarbonate transport system permease component
MLNPLYVPNLSRIGGALVDLFSDGRIWPHLDATFSAALGGLALGTSCRHCLSDAPRRSFADRRAGSSR